MLRSSKGSTPFRNAGGSTSGGLGASGSSSSIFKSSSSNNHQASGTNAENALHPNLGLHSAAATGNVGLVKFALDNGQPHTSILNGLLPLHAACSGGSEPVVRLLISYGADVNTPRAKPTKANGTGPGTGTGTEGSTPLHFASANGHTSIARLLLESGARPTARDRDRQTPLSLASSQGHAACASLLKSWIAAYGPNGLAQPLIGSSSRSNSFTQDTPSPLRNQRSFESLSSAAAGVKASLRNHKKQALAKVSSNPNLKSIASSSSYHGSPSFIPPPLPTAGRTAPDSTATVSPAPHTLSSVPNALTQEYKRRPSLPSIFEKAAHPSSTMQLLSSTSTSQQPESIEELDQDAGNVFGKPPVSPNRPTHRLLGKRSLGLISKASSGNLNEETPLPSIDPKFISQNQSTTAEERKPATLPVPVSVRSRSGSIDVLGQPSSGHLGRSDLTSSPNSSTGNFETSSRQTSTPSHGYRPRKSSNLSVTSSNPSPLIAQDSSRDRAGSLSVEQGRKRSQSTTCVPKQLHPASELESLRKLSLSQQGTTSGRQPNGSQSDDTKEFLQSNHTTTKEKGNTATRYRSHRSPLIPSKLLAEDTETRNPPSPSLGLRQLHSQRSNSSLVSSSSSSNTNLKASRGNSFTHGGIDEEPVPRSHPESHSTARTYGSASSIALMKSFGAGMSAQEQAQAILRTAEEKGTPSADVPAISLTQMLAAYGEALAQERRGASISNSPDHLRKQGSMASISSKSRNHMLPSVTEAPDVITNGDPLSKPSHRTHPGSLTPISTPPDSPQMTRSRADSSATSFSRSPSWHRQQKSRMMSGATLSPSLQISQSPSPVLSPSPRLEFNGRSLESSGVIDDQVMMKGASPTSNDTVFHRHSPSLPNDLSQFAGPDVIIAPVSLETTPRSKQRQSRHRPSLSDPHLSKETKRHEPPSPLSFAKSSTPQTPELQETPSFNTIENEAKTPLSDYDMSPGIAIPNESQVSEMPNSGRPERSGHGAGGKRKGGVKAFLNGIKNNVVSR